MKNISLKFKILILVLSTFYFLLSIFYVDAQTSPQFLVSWQAQSYAPSWYKGKIFPTKDSSVEIGFELIDSGKITDLSKTAVRWYVNDKLVKNESDGLGIKSLKFIATDYPGQDAEIRISIPSYKTFGPLDKIMNIPIAQPQAIINAPYPNRQISAGKNTFQVIPFFFSTKDLKKIFYKWFVDNREVTDLGANFQNLDLNVPQETPKGTVINIKATVKNLLKEMEFASGNLNVEIK